MSVLSVAAVQHDIVWENPEENFVRLAPVIAAAANDGARLIVLSEMFPTGFSMDSSAIAEPSDGPSHEFLVTMATENDAHVCGSIATRRAEGLPVNRFVLASPDGSARHYDKIHPFTYGGEHEHYQGGSELVTWDVDGVRVSPFVCYDLRFADEFWALGPDTDLFVVVANWPAKRRGHWKALLRARAIENLAYVVATNRVGEGGGIAYAGDSVALDPLGEGDPVPDEPAVVVGSIDTDHVAAVRDRFGFLADRR